MPTAPVAHSRSHRFASRATRARSLPEIPGIYPPVRLGDRWYVDGGVHPVPIEFVLPLGADYVIAVDLAFPTTSCTANSSRVLPVGTCHAF